MTSESQVHNNRGKPIFLKNKDIPECYGKNVYADELFKCLLHVVPSSEIKGIQRIGGLWRLYIADKNVRIKLITNGLNIRSANVCVYDLNPFLPNGREDTLRLVVKDIPLSVHESVITDELERKKCKISGKMFYQKLRVDGKLTECLTGDRVVYIEPLTTPLPRTIMFGPFKGRIFHFGQPDTDKTNSLCSKCLRPGHLRSACMNEIVCRSCKQTGHIVADCPTHDTPTDPSNQRPEKVPSSRWSQKTDPKHRHEGHQADNAPSRDRYDTDFPPAQKEPELRPNQRRSNSHPRTTQGKSRASPTMSPNRHHEDARRDRENSRKPRETNTCASDTAYPAQPTPPDACPSDATPYRPAAAEPRSETADQTAPPKATNQQQSKITQFIEKARQHSSTTNREHNGEPADCRVVSDQHSSDEEDGSDCSREDEFVSAEFSECGEDTITEHQSDLSAESPDVVKARDKVTHASKRKQKPKKKTSKKK